MAAMAEMELVMVEMERVRVWSKWKKGKCNKREDDKKQREILGNVKVYSGGPTRHYN